MSFLIVLVVLLCLYVLLFEFSNGFHDTSNTVSTVVYTRAMKPKFAVLRSGLWNALGVLLWWLTIAITISHIFPVDALMQVSVIEKTSFFLAVLLSVIGWNLFMASKDLPSSTMHALVWSAIWTSIGYVVSGHISWNQLPRHSLEDVALSLFASPLIAFLIALVLVYILKHSAAWVWFFSQKPSKEPPPLRMKILMILTSTATSFSHGTNEAQKWIGLMMAILVVFFPMFFSFDSIPLWVIALVAWVLWLWVVVWWRWVVKTLWAKLGKRTMTYWQWLVGELAATSTILVSTIAWLPVSSSHVLASGFMGALSATDWEKTFRKWIVKTIMWAWLVTVPVTIVLWFVFYQFAIWYAWSHF